MQMQQTQAADPAGMTDLDQLIDNLRAAHSKIQNLEVALKSARVIGIAVGIVMTTHKVTDGQAFDMLVVVSQGSGRKLREIAEDVALTGALDLSGWTARQHAQHVA